MEITVNISDEDLVSGISNLGKPEIKALIRQVLFDERKPVHLAWEVIAECLEELLVQYTDEVNYYTEQELEETFGDHGFEPDDHYSIMRTAPLSYQSATEHVLNHVRNVLAGKPESVGG